LQGLRQQVAGARILVILEPRSNTMRLGIHADQLADALDGADQVWLFAMSGLLWDPRQTLQPLGAKARVLDTTQAIVEQVVAQARPGDHLLVMSNGGFEGIHQRLLDALARTHITPDGN
jgi:UDP-N-acetylmuramate: L-alanyl-gamma-D-glutamyl-meso-diaminopimelate ligase